MSLLHTLKEVGTFIGGLTGHFLAIYFLVIILLKDLCNPRIEIYLQKEFSFLFRMLYRIIVILIFIGIIPILLNPSFNLFKPFIN